MKHWYRINVDKKTGELKKPPKPPMSDTYWLKRPVHHTDYDDHWEYKKQSFPGKDKPNRRGQWQVHRQLPKTQ